MKLTFLGTRGEIEAKTPQHRMHASLLVSYRGARVMIDYGLDWLGKFERLHPDAIALTHAHPDHAWGLEKWRAVSSPRAGEDVANVKELPHRRSTSHQEAGTDKDLRHHIRGVSG